MNRYDRLSRLRSKLYSVLLRQRPSNKVCRCRFDSNLREHHAAGLLGNVFVLLDHLGDEGDFSSNVQVVSTIFGACFEGLDWS